MLQDTVRRIIDIPDVQAPIVICNAAHRFIVAEQLLEVGIQNAKIILEPFGKNTAPAAAIAALVAPKDALLLVIPADHLIKNVKSFLDGVLTATQIAKSGHLVTFGIQPTQPETGYGYIQRANPLDQVTAYHAAQFVEKPTLEKAKEYLASGDYYWNSGMFMFQASVYLNELNAQCPDIVKVCRSVIQEAKSDLDFVRLDEAKFNECPSDSIDYAVMEKSKNVVVIPLHDSEWSDLGSWDSIYETKLKDVNNNVIKGDVFAENVANSYLHAENRLLAVVGVTDHIIIETADAVLVAHKDASQDVKKIVRNLEAKQRSEIEYHRRVYRPWGFYEVIDNSEKFQVKRITVKPGARLSLQMHKFRSEHWVVIKGTAEVTCGDNVFTLEANQSTYIPVLEKHRLGNAGADDLVIIEVQTGSYLGEDDIIRFEDHYGRDVQSVNTIGSEHGIN